MEKKNRILGNVLLGDLREQKSYVYGGLIIYFLGISFLEILAYTVGGIFTILASRLWFGTGMVLLTGFILRCIRRIRMDLRERRFFCMIGMGILLFLFGFYTGNMGYADVNPDAAQQAAAGVNAFWTVDWNYAGTAFLRYPARQYLLAAVPTLLFGRSVPALHLGFGGLFLIGLTEMGLEFREILKQRGLNEAYALLPIYGFLGFRFIEEYYLNFEQAITPAALTMIAIALFLRMLRKPSLFTTVSLAWIGCLMCDSYTPGMASLALLICAMFLYILKTAWTGIRSGKENAQKVEKGKWVTSLLFGGIILNSLLFYTAALLAGRSDGLTEFREDFSMISFAAETWFEFFTDRNAVFLGIFIPFILVYLLWAIFGRGGLYHFMAAGWILCVVLFSSLLVGYTSYEKCWVMQRNLIVIPVFLTGFSDLVLRMIEKYKIRIRTCIQITILGLFFLLGIYGFRQPHQSFKYFGYIRPMKYAVQTIQELAHAEKLDGEVFQILLLTDNILQSNIYDYERYFQPLAAAVSADTQIAANVDDTGYPLLVIGETRESVERYGAEVQEKTFKDRRYHEEYVWYYGICR